MTRQLTPQEWGMMIGRKCVVWGENIKYIVYPLQNVQSVQKEMRIFVSEYPVDSILRNGWVSHPANWIKPVLRTLDQMTKEELACYENLFGVYLKLRMRIKGDIINKFNYRIEEIDWLTQKGFDIRGWIDEGLAVKYNPEIHGGWI